MFSCLDILLWMMIFIVDSIRTMQHDQNYCPPFEYWLLSSFFPFSFSLIEAFVGLVICRHCTRAACLPNLILPVEWNLEPSLSSVP